MGALRELFAESLEEGNVLGDVLLLAEAAPEGEPTVQKSFEEDKHPRADDGRFGSKPGEHQGKPDTPAHGKDKPAPAQQDKPSGQTPAPGQDIAKAPADSPPRFIPGDGLSEQEAGDFNHRLDQVGKVAEGFGFDPDALRQQIHADYHLLQAERRANPDGYSPASNGDVLSHVINQAWQKATDARRSKEAEEFRQMKEAHLARDVKPPKEFGGSQAAVKVVSKRPVEKVESLVKRLLGEHVTLQHVAGLVGAPDDATVSITPGTQADRITVRVDHPAYKAKRTIGKDYDGKTFIHNDEFWMNEKHQGNGLGMEVFAMQVENAQKLGVDYIDCHAARINPRDPAKPHNGYYTWPRFGYDQKINSFRFSQHEHDTIKAAFPHAESVLDVMLTKGGQDWWKKNGVDLFHAKFDLSEGSRSLKVFHAYLAERATRTVSKSMRDWAATEIDDAGDGCENPCLSAEDLAALDRAWDKLCQAPPLTPPPSPPAPPPPG